jgi:hypothetical protein
LIERAKQGATVVITGAVNDEDRLPVSQTESFAVGARDYLVRFEGEKIQRIEKGEFKNSNGRPLVTKYGAGSLIRCPLPLELGDSMPALVALYRFALAQARVAPIFAATPRTPAVLVLPSVFRDVVLYTFVSESNRDTAMQVTDLQSRKRFPVFVPAGRTAMVLIDRRTGRRITSPPQNASVE